MGSTNLDRILAKIEYVVAWALVAALSVAGLSNIPTQLISSCFYFVVAWVVYPHNPIPHYQKIIIGSIAFLMGICLKLI